MELSLPLMYLEVDALMLEQIERDRLHALQETTAGFEASRKVCAQLRHSLAAHQPIKINSPVHRTGHGRQRSKRGGGA